MPQEIQRSVPDRHDWTEAPICPHCGHADRNAAEIPFSMCGEARFACPSCGQIYLCIRMCSVVYQTELIEEEEPKPPPPAQQLGAASLTGQISPQFKGIDFV